MRKKIAVIFIIVTILLICARYGYRESSEKYYDYLYNKETVIAGPDTESLAIFIEPDDPATRAASNYLAFALEQTLGTEAEIVTEQDEQFRGIRILCGTDIPEPEQKKPKFIFITTADAANDEEDPVYSVLQDENSVSIFIPEQENCFGAVKAITDRWLQKNCGLESGGELRISQAMIDRQLLHLSTAITGEFRILSQNLCFSDDGEGKTVEERAERFFRLVEEYQPDLIGTQECSWQWLQLLQDVLGDRYEIYGNSRDGPYDPEVERDAILFRKDRFEQKDGETFWLSNTPSEPTSKLNYEGVWRICTWALLHDLETEETILFSNTHLQNGYQEEYGEVRYQQADILLRRLRKGNNYLTEYPGFLTGDFNGVPEEHFYSHVTSIYNDSKKTAIHDHSKVDYSYHDYGRVQYLLDYCFHSPKNVTILDYQILDKQYNGYVSDHYGILVTAIVN